MRTRKYRAMDLEELGEGGASEENRARQIAILLWRKVAPPRAFDVVGTEHASPQPSLQSFLTHLSSTSDSIPNPPRDATSLSLSVQLVPRHLLSSTSLSSCL